jgi:hypothetical protein
MGFVQTLGVWAKTEKDLTKIICKRKRIFMTQKDLPNSGK